MAGSVKKYDTAKGARYMVRYRKPDGSSTDKRGFVRKKDADAYLASVTITKATGDYIDPARAKVTVGSLYDTWFAGKAALKPSSSEPLPRTWRLHVEPEWGNRSIGDIMPSEVKAWVSSLTTPCADGGSGKSASVALRALGILSGILAMAVDDRRISRNPAARLKNLPKKPKHKPGRAYLTHSQLHTLAAASTRPEIVLLLGYTGLRWGEMAALRVRNVNVLRRRLQIERNAPLVKGVMVEGEVKNWQKRSVAFPKLLMPHIDTLMRGKGPDDLLVANRLGGYQRPPRHGTGWLERAVESVQAADENFPRVTAHDFRHTAASLAVAAGANVKVLQTMLGHESASVTLDIYSDLFDHDLDQVANALESAAATALKAAPPAVVPLPNTRRAHGR